jgi:hypothetical protein
MDGCARMREKARERGVPVCMRKRREEGGRSGGRYGEREKKREGRGVVEAHERERRGKDKREREGKRG